jgi:ubiquinone/menaquinone biosynthesis C-methylase UbiE
VITAEKRFDRTDAESAMSRNAGAIHGKVNNYLKWNLEVFEIERGKRILDIGCGPGLYFDSVMTVCSPSFYMSVDCSAGYINQMAQKIAGHPNCEAMQLDIMDSEQVRNLYEYAFDYVLCFDVLEHIEDDEKALRNIRELIQNTGSGHLFLRVPALQSIFGENDKSIGHYRRYSLQLLKSLLERCSFAVKSIGYQNFVGVVPWYIIGRVLKRSLSVSGDEGKIFDAIVPLIQSIERTIAPPIGLSLYCVCAVRKR